MAGGTQAQVLDCSFILCVGFIIALFPFQLPPLSFLEMSETNQHWPSADQKNQKERTVPPL